MVRQTGTIDVKELIEQAKLGDPKSMDKLAQLAYARLEEYFYRAAVDRELAAELAQETLLKMIESLNSLHKVDSFWPWIFQIASTKIKQSFREHQHSATVRFSTLTKNQLENALRDNSNITSGYLIRREQSFLIKSAISKLKERSKAIVFMRCFDDMSYLQISLSVGCSETAARVSFLRAKRKLKNLLQNQMFNVTTAAG